MSQFNLATTGFPIDELSSASNRSKNEEEAKTHNSYQSMERLIADIQVILDQVQDDILPSKLVVVGGDDSKNGWTNPTEQRADALEYLLELCARLLNHNKLEELAGVLKPFEEDVVPSRETTIWLTNSLMTA